MISSADVRAVPILLGQYGLSDHDLLLELVSDALVYDVRIREVLPPQFEHILLTTKGLTHQYRAFWLLSFDEEPPSTKLLRDTMYNLLRMCFQRSCFGMYVNVPKEYEDYKRVGWLPVNGVTLYSVIFEITDNSLRQVEMPRRIAFLKSMHDRLIDAGVDVL